MYVYRKRKREEYKRKRERKKKYQLTTLNIKLASSLIESWQSATVNTATSLICIHVIFSNTVSNHHPSPSRLMKVLARVFDSDEIDVAYAAMCSLISSLQQVEAGVVASLICMNKRRAIKSYLSVICVNNPCRGLRLYRVLASMWHRVNVKGGSQSVSSNLELPSSTFV